MGVREQLKGVLLRFFLNSQISGSGWISSLSDQPVVGWARPSDPF